MSKAMSKKEKAEVSGPLDLDLDWGGSPITSQDIILPRLLMMQPMSDLVTEGEAAFGDIIESLGNKKLGDFKTPLEIIPFYLQKVYVEYDVTNGTGQDKKFLRMVPITASNDNLPYDDEEKNDDGKMIPVMRDRCMNYYVLIPTEIDAGTSLPHVLTFRRTSIKAGKKLATQMYIKNKDAGLPPPAVMCEISVNKTSNDKGTFAIMDVDFTTKTKDEHIAVAKKWVRTIIAGEAKIHEESFDSEEEKQVSNGSDVPMDTSMAEPEQF